MKNSLTVSSNYTAFPTDEVIFVHQSSAITITLPANPYLNSEIEVSDLMGAAATYPITLNGNGYMINGSPTYEIGQSYGAVRLQFNGQLWSIKS